jgi:hypothetical protein
MGIKRIFNKADGNTVEPATSTRPDRVVKHSRRWYGTWDGKPIPRMSREQAQAELAQQLAERQQEQARQQADFQAELAKHRAELEAEAERNAAGVAPPPPPAETSTAGILEREF